MDRDGLALALALDLGQRVGRIIAVAVNDSLCVAVCDAQCVALGVLNVLGVALRLGHAQLLDERDLYRVRFGLELRLGLGLGQREFVLVGHRLALDFGQCLALWRGILDKQRKPVRHRLIHRLADRLHVQLCEL